MILAPPSSFVNFIFTHFIQSPLLNNCLQQICKMQKVTMQKKQCGVKANNTVWVEKKEKSERSNVSKGIATCVHKASTDVSVGHINELSTLEGKRHKGSGGVVYVEASTTSNGRRAKRCFALDCEMVGVGPKKVSVVARVSIVNSDGSCVFDSFVKIDERITDYRTAFSGIRPGDLQSEKALPFGEVRSNVRKILNGCILVGHGLRNDLKSLNLYTCAYSIRDTTEYIPYMKHWWDGTYRPRRLRDLIWDQFGRIIQNGEHNSIEDAASAMSLYNLVKEEWDSCFGYDNEVCLPFMNQLHLYNPPLAQSHGCLNVIAQAYAL